MLPHVDLFNLYSSAHMNLEAATAAAVSLNGYATVHDVLTEQIVEHLINTVNHHHSASEISHRGAVFAGRNLLANCEAVRRLAVAPEVVPIVHSILGPAARAVKATFFDKTPQVNWKVPPHQDVTIAVKHHLEAPGFGPWTTKAGVPNVQPPVQILEQMLALRFHLDDCDETNGALKVWPGSHSFGRLKDSGISAWTSANSPVTCPVNMGGVMLMRPLLLHASSPAVVPSHRRVIHIEYAGCSLPHPLEWLDEIPLPGL